MTLPRESDMLETLGAIAAGVRRIEETAKAAREIRDALVLAAVAAGYSQAEIARATSIDDGQLSRMVNR